MSTYLGKSPQGIENHEGCMGVQFLDARNQTPITTVRKWSQTNEQADMLQAKMGVARSSRNNELQADFLAGWHVAEYIRIFGDEAKEFRILEDGIRAFYSRGDYQFNSPQHHGTPQQRYDAFNEGLKIGDVSLTSAWNKSMEYRRKLGG